MQKFFSASGICAIVIWSAAFIPVGVFAQTSPGGAQVVLSWHAADSYVPPAYQDKALPNADSIITASVEVFSDGSLSNLKSQTIYWYLDDSLLGGGPGAQSITFSPFGGQTGDETLQVQIPDYPGGLLVRSVSIPIMEPMAVIEASYPGGNFSHNPAIITALPFFFDATSSDNLSFAWSVNGTAVNNTENPDSLQVNLPPGTPAGASIAIALQLTNPSDSTVATAEQTIIYQPLP